MVKFTGKNVIRLIIASVILITGALFVFNKPTNAAPVTYLKASAMTPEQLVVSYAYYYALRNTCTATDTLTSSDSLLSVISNSTKGAYVGHIAEIYAGGTLNVEVSGDDGKMQCGGIFKAAVRLWTGKSIESLDQATKEDILTKLGYKNEVANRYYCYTKFSGAPNTNYPPLYSYDSTVTSQSLHPFLSLSANGIKADNVYEDVLGYDGFTTSGLASIDVVLNVLTALGDTIGTDKYNDFCNRVANQFVGMGASDTYAEQSTTSTATWKLDGDYLIYDFVFGSIYDNSAPVLNAIGRYYTYYYYYTSNSASYGCGGINLGEKDTYIKSIEGSGSTTLSAADKLLWIDNQKYPYDEIVKITGENGALKTYSYYQKNSSLTEMNSTIEIMEIQDVEAKTCHEIANSMSVESQNISNEINRNYGKNPYGAVLGLLIADNNKAPSVNDPIKGTGDSETVTTCAIDGIGWLICPITKAMSKLVDAAYGFVTEMLTTPALNTDTSGNITGGVVENSMYEMWKIMRTFANIAFVIAFLIITFSQMTSVGINNYGIKKMLPKLVIAAILVNISYFMCAIAIDLSNLAGFGINDLLENINKSVAVTTEEPTLKILAGSIDFTIGAATAGVAVAATGGAWAALSLLVPGLIAAVMAIVTVFLVLTLRQALIILLVVVSPLALVAYILPNTESWYKKWKDLFITMLLMFPIISAIFAISKLASSIVVSGANGHGMIALMGMFIQFIPLAITPLVLKSAGGVLNKFAGMVNNPNRGPFDAMKKGAVNFRKREGNRANADAMNLGDNPSKKQWLKNGNGIRRGVLRFNARRDFLDKSMQSDVNRTTLEDTVRAASADGSTAGTPRSGLNKQMQKQMSPGAYSRSMANATSAMLKMRKEEVEERMQKLAAESSNTVNEIAEYRTKLEIAIKSGDTVTARAAQNLLTKTAPGREMVHKLYTETTIENAFSQNNDLLNNLKNDLNSAGLKSSDAGLSKFAYTDAKLSEIDQQKSTYEGLSMSEMASQSKDTLANMATAGALTPEVAYNMINSKLQTDIAKDKLPMLENMAKQHTPPAQRPTILGPDGRPLPPPNRS